MGQGRALRALRASVLTFHAAKTVSLLANAVVFPRLREVPSGSFPTVSLLVPARDESANLPRTLPTWLDQPVAQILLLDDGSTDGTSDLADASLGLIRGSTSSPVRRFPTAGSARPGRATSSPRLPRVTCSSSATPTSSCTWARWRRSWRRSACRKPTSSRSSLANTRVAWASGCSYRSIDEVLLSYLPYGLLSLPVPEAAAANGQLIAFRREAYDLIGGHAAVRSAVVEDVRLAYTARQAGLRLGLALGGDYVQARMYDGYATTVRGFGKSVRAGHGGSRALMTMTAAGHLAAYTLPWLLGRRDRGWRLAALVGPAQRLLVNASTGRGAPWEAVLVPMTPLAALPVYAIAMRRRATWKGRTVG